MPAISQTNLSALLFITYRQQFETLSAELIWNQLFIVRAEAHSNIVRHLMNRGPTCGNQRNGLLVWFHKNNVVIICDLQHLWDGGVVQTEATVMGFQLWKALHLPKLTHRVESSTKSQEARKISLQKGVWGFGEELWGIYRYRVNNKHNMIHMYPVVIA